MALLSDICSCYQFYCVFTGYIGSVAYGAVVALVLKLLACTLQQKLIGENLSQVVSVRQFVGINTKIIRSMRLILAEPGLGMAKVSILIGGPDWPTSVLCGIMRLDLIPILTGTLPVILLILPTMLTGSFTYMNSLQINGTPQFPWAGVAATIFATLTVIVQFGSMLIAAFYLEQTASQREAEINAIPIDKEVQEAEEKAQYIRDIYTEVTQWDTVPRLAKAVLTMSLFCVVVSCYMVQLFPNLCFSDYELTYTIDKHLDGDWKNLVLPFGTLAIIFFLVSCVLLQFYIWWANVSVTLNSLFNTTRYPILFDAFTDTMLIVLLTFYCAEEGIPDCQGKGHITRKQQPANY